MKRIEIAALVLLQVLAGPAYPANRPNVKAVFDSLPLSFEANAGQFDRQVSFLARGRGKNLFLTVEGMVLTLGGGAGGRPPSVIRFELQGRTKDARLQGEDRVAGTTNYFYGDRSAKFAARYITNVPSFARVRQPEVYPGVDVLYYSNNGLIEYDFIVAPAADFSQIKLSIRGHRSAALTESGDLVLHTDDGDVRVRKPLAYQERDGRRTEIPVRYVLDGNQLRFDVGDYERSRALVIDPILSFSTRLGGNGNETANAIAVDASGNVYVAGTTNSTNFPLAGALQSKLAGASDVFVTKLNPSGSALVYSTYLGGRSGDSIGNGIAVDSQGNAYVTGTTTTGSFPVTKGAYQTSKSEFESGFVSKLSPQGNVLVYSTYIRDAIETNAIAINGSGEAYVTGGARSGFITTAGAFQPASAAPVCGFAAKLNTTGSAMSYATFLCGSANFDGGDRGYGIAVDAAGHAYVTGRAPSTNFPVTGGAYQPFRRGINDAFITKVNPTGGGLVYSTYLGGSDGQRGFGIAIDSLGQAYVVGRTTSLDFPVLRAFQPAKSYAGTGYYNVSEGFVTKLNAAGSGLLYSSYLGGPGCVGTGALCDPVRGFDQARAVALDAAGNAYVTGGISSLALSQVDPIQPVATPYDGSLVPFLAKIQERSSAVLVYLLTLGTRSGFSEGLSDNSPGKGVAVDTAGNAYVATRVYSTPFPVTPGALQVVGAGFDDTAVFKVSPGRFTTSLQASNATPTCAQTITLTATVTGAVPGGQVTFSSGGSSIGTTLVTDGTATLATNLAAGVHELTAVYTGDNKLSRPLFLPVKRVSGC